jgi:uncharacterized protein YbjQ (UPF0145 family)
MPLNPLPDFTATTGFNVDGYDIVQTFGIVRGIVVRSRSVFGTLGAVLQAVRGGDISLGANAAIAVRYDATEIMAGVSEVLCYGTAVRLAPRLAKSTPA